MKVFIVSLKNSKRRESIEKLMLKHKLEFEFFNAVNGNELSATEISTLCDLEAIKKNPRWLNKGAIGCALSHLYIYEQMVNQNIDKAIIMEDDMLVNESFIEIFNALKKRKLEEEVLMIYYRAFNNLRFSRLDSCKINSKFSIYKPYSLADIPMTTGCYYVTKTACKKLIDVIQPVRVTADSWKFFILNSNFHNLKVIYPRAINDAGFQSEIDYSGSYSVERIKNFKKILDAFNNPIVNLIRKIRRKKMEKKMSNFSIISKESILEKEKISNKVDKD